MGGGNTANWAIETLVKSWIWKLYLYIKDRRSCIKSTKPVLNMHAQIKKRSLLCLTCLLRFNKFFLEFSHLSLKIVTIKSHYWVTWGHWSLVANATRDQWPQVTHLWLYIITIFRDKWLHSSKNLLNPRSAALRLINNHTSRKWALQSQTVQCIFWSYFSGK